MEKDAPAHVDTPLLVLVVDDNPHLRVASARVMKQAGYRVIEASSGEEALIRIRESRPQIVLLDVELGGMTGFEVCRQVKQDPELMRTLIIILSATAVKTIDKTQGLDLGADAYLMRPIGNAELTAQVRAMVRTYRAESELRRARDHLEEVVSERTAELAESNAKLKAEIREHRTTLEALKSSQSLLQSLVDGISDPIILLDGEGSVRKFNLAAQRYFDGIDLNPLLKTPIRCAQSEPGSPPLHEAVKQGIPVHLERPCLKRSGRTLRVVSYPITRDKNEVDGAVLHVSDITSQLMFQKQRIQHEKLKSIGMLVSGIAHEINNPCHFISFNMPILQDYVNAVTERIEATHGGKPDLELAGLPYGEFKQEFLSLISNVTHGAQRIARIVSRLRDFARVRQPSERILVNIAEAVDRVLSLTGFQVKEQLKTIQQSIPNDVKVFLDSPDALEQVLMNLILNAAQAIDHDHGSLTLSCDFPEDSPQHVRILVEDNGCGMPPDVLDRVFEPFFSTKSSGDHSGTGLGLYVCADLVQNMGGEIDVESRPGKGTRFSITLPKAPV